MPHSHGVHNCSLSFGRKGRQLDLRESRSLTQIFQRNLLLAHHRLWEYVYTFVADCEDSNGDDGDGDDGDDGDDDGVGDGGHPTRST